MNDIITTKEQWEEKIGSRKMSQFLQSWLWGEFQNQVGRQVWHLDLEGEYVQIIKMVLPYQQNYLYIPRTSVKFSQSKIAVIIALAKQEKSLFVRVEPLSQSLLEFGFKKVKPVQPAKTLILDLSKTEDDLLLAMHQKTRYNIRLAMKKGVVIKQCLPEQFSLFYDLIQGTFLRKNKKIFAEEYYRKLFASPLVKTYYAEYDGKALAANLYVYYGDTATYLHGGSAEEYKNIMAPHLLQWEMIRQAKKQSYQYYDFWGIESRYPGVTRFKVGFGGREIIYPGTFDLPLRRLAYLGYDFLRRFK